MQLIDDSGREIVRRAMDNTLRIGRADVMHAIDALTAYKRGKANLETRIVEDEQWYRLRHWEVMRRKSTAQGGTHPEPSSAWLFSTLSNKHADAIDNIPTANILPREPSDVTSAEQLSAIIPVITERCDFEDTYSHAWWDKLKQGTAAYMVSWDNRAENGVGDIAITDVDMLNIFWEPGIDDIQKSKMLFIVDLRDTKELEKEYPDKAGKLSADCGIDVAQYIYDDDIDTSGKSLVVDCYYKTISPSGKTLLHYMKFVGEELLYASENDPELSERGFYDHGQYPVVFDALFPEKGTPVGFGYVSICKDPQMYIDKLSANILESSMMATKKRYFVSASTNVNADEFLDWSKPLIRVEGELSDARIKELTVSPLDSIYVNILQMKIDEMKETSSNRDFNTGGGGSGVTAAAAIAALQEAGNKTSRDMISASYRAYQQVIYLVIELIRQFYDEVRVFRITGSNGEMSFAEFSNAQIRDQELPPDYAGQTNEADYVPSFRRPIFDIKVSAEKKNPFSQMAMNETAKELYRLGFFDPNRAQEATGALNMMEFEGKDEVEQYISQGNTLSNQLKQLSELTQKLAAIVQQTTGTDLGVDVSSPAPAAQTMQSTVPTMQSTVQSPAESSTGGIAAQAARAQGVRQTSYAQRLARNAVPDMSDTSKGLMQ